MSIINHQISVSIDGRRLFAFKSFELKQSLNTHHSFELVIDIETGANRYVHDLKDSAAWLGKPLTVYVSPSGKPTFLGVITGVSLHRRNSDYGHILVKGRSATYRLETGLNCHSWNDRTIGEIVSELTASAGVRARVNPEYTKRLDYVCQYNESDFTFIRRLARQYNEWLYYDGTELIFGRPTLPDAVPLEFGTSLASLDIGVQALARPARVFSYRSLQDQSISEKTPDKPSGQDPLGHKAFLASMNLYKQPTRQYALSRIHYMSEMETYVRKKQEAETAESHYVRGTSENASLGVGSVVNLKSSFLERLGSVSAESLGRFLITEITHTVGEDSYYLNHFKAIPAVVHTLPAPDVELPVAQTQMATVVSNADPRGKGRVQVRMNWQTEGMRTDWIRVMTPDGGSSESVKSNRGFVFIPEVGDHVLVGFRYNDPGRPYVMGSLFNGTTAGGGGQENISKTIVTRSGHTLAFNDMENGNWGITLKDAKGNVFHMDTKGSSISITAPQTITLNAANIMLNASNKIGLQSSSVSKDGTKNGVIEMAALKTVSLKSDMEDVKISAESKGIGLKAKTGISSESDSLSLSSRISSLDTKEHLKIQADGVNMDGGSSMKISSSDTDII
nr:contractile injection system protein, VgrG/Pvc8 family [Prevotella denticola]